jgi:mono/diheme cytochrome c family protein
MLSRKIKTGLLVGIGALLISLTYISGWPWNMDMVQQPALRPYQRIMLPPPDSVPVDGEQVLPRNVIGERLHNPQAPTTESTENGKKMFLTYCAPCHGLNGMGHGTVAQGEFRPPDLTSDRIKKLNDGLLYGTITDGWLTMPSYRETMTVQERWNVVNYLRTLQGEKSQSLPPGRPTVRPVE